MAGNKYLANVSGTVTEIVSAQTSVGAGSAGVIPALDPTGRFDVSMMPVGIGPETQVVQASEALTAGDFVNVWNSTGTFRVRRADGSTSGKEAHGFVLASVLSAANATIYELGQVNTAVSSATPGVVYLSASTPGGFTATAPSGTGQTVQRLGVATSATTILTASSQPIVLA